MLINRSFHSRATVKFIHNTKFSSLTCDGDCGLLGGRSSGMSLRAIPYDHLLYNGIQWYVHTLWRPDRVTCAASSQVYSSLADRNFVRFQCLLYRKTRSHESSLRDAREKTGEMNQSRRCTIVSFFLSLLFLLFFFIFFFFFAQVAKACGAYSDKRLVAHLIKVTDTPVSTDMHVQLAHLPRNVLLSMTDN